MRSTDTTSQTDICFIKAPPFLKHMPVLAQRCQNSNCRLEEKEARYIRDRIVHDHVGGSFWEVAPPFYPHIIINCPLTWNIEKLRQHRNIVGKHENNENILFILALHHPLAHLDNIDGSPIAVEGQYNPHPLTRQVEKIYHYGSPQEIGEVSLLCALKDVPSFIEDGSSLKQLTCHDALYILHAQTRYISPFNAKTCHLVEILDLLVLWRDIIKENREIDACVGISLWKKKAMVHFLSKAPGAPYFPRYVKHFFHNGISQHQETIGIWASQLLKKKYQALLKGKNLSLRYIEDGFIRSKGLGSALTPPCSITVDKRGICHDPSTPSDLEYILEHQHFSTRLLSRAHALIERLKHENISKYAAHETQTYLNREIASQRAQGKKIILVPGQVHQDLSVERGGQTIKDNLTLLKYVRRDQPHAWIIYRPHPDVEAGYRKGRIEEQQILRFANDIDRKTPITALFKHIDALHTLTSLSGFEALIRDIEVTTWGIPFYAGWGLTKDMAPIPPRRTRRLTKEEIVAGALITYPRYLDPLTHIPCPVEIVIDRLRQPEIWQNNIWMSLRKLQQLFINLTRSLKHKLRCSHD